MPAAWSMADCALAERPPITTTTALCPDPLRVALAYNPHAGHFCAQELARWQNALQAAGHTTRLVDSLDYARDPRAHESDVVCIVGGDGTARMVVGAGLRAAQTPTFALLPAGTVNLIARETGCDSAERLAPLIAALARDPQETDAHFHGLLDDQPFLCCASAGPDSAVVARVTPALKRRWGRMAYVLAMAAQLVTWPRPRIEANVDGVPYRAEAIFLLKGRFYAGPWTLDDLADLRKPEFRVLIMPRARRRDIARLALSAMVSPRLADPAWQRLSAQRVVLYGPQDATRPVPIQADGDILGQTPARFSIATAPVPFLSPSRHRTGGGPV